MRGLGVSGWCSCGAFRCYSKAPLLHHVFYQRFFPRSLPRNCGWAGKRDRVITSHLLDDGGNVPKRVWLTTKTCPGTPVHFQPDRRLPTPKRRKRLHPPDSSGAGGEVGVPRRLSSRLGTPGTCFRTQQAWGCQLVSPAEGVCALALVHFY